MGPSGGSRWMMGAEGLKAFWGLLKGGRQGEKKGGNGEAGYVSQTMP